MSHFNLSKYINNQQVDKISKRILSTRVKVFDTIAHFYLIASTTMEKLKVGDRFFLCEKVFVMVGHYCVESGRQYDLPHDNSTSRTRLKTAITEVLAKEGIKHDISIVDRFVNFIAKDVPAGNVHLPPGNFVVTRIDAFTDNEETVHCHRVGDPTDIVHFQQNRSYGHYWFKALAG